VADDSRNADVGAPYAQALFGLADEAKSLPVVAADLKSLNAARTESAELRDALASPLVSNEDKGKVLAAIAEATGASQLTRNFIGLLCANHRASALPAVIAAFDKLYAARRGVVAAEVVSAVALTADQHQAITDVLAKMLGKAPEITTRVDPAILGGLRVRVGSRLFDSSIKSRLDSLKFALKRA